MRISQQPRRYSNNFLYKVTACQAGRRLALKPTAGLMRAAGESVEEDGAGCGERGCGAAVARLEPGQAADWRERAGGGQAARRAVITELAGRAGLCPQFIQLVTGAGLSCIARVSRQAASHTAHSPLL